MKFTKNIKKYRYEIFIFIIMFIFFFTYFVRLDNCTEAMTNDTEDKKESISDLIDVELPFKPHFIMVNININTDESVKVPYKSEPSYDKYEFVKGWVIEKTNVRVDPSFHSGILEVYNHNKQIEYAKYDKDWSVIKYENDYAFIQNECISNEICNYDIVNVPEYDKYEGFKTWMPYTSISCIESPQYKLQQIAYTGTYGIRMYEGRYCIAVGTAVTSDVGVYIDVILENGTVIPCIVGDIKADIHTNDDNIFTLHSNCCSEFIVDMKHLDSYVRLTGNVSKACAEWNSKVVKFKVYNDVDIVDW